MRIAETMVAYDAYSDRMLADLDEASEREYALSSHISKITENMFHNLPVSEEAGREIMWALEDGDFDTVGVILTKALNEVRVSIKKDITE